MAIPEGLVGQMSLAEKIGQLTMVTANHAVTGPNMTADIERGIREGRIGSLFNLHGRAAVRTVQRMAVQETRLGVPLFFGFDVIHGFRTIFPIPLAEACAFDPELWEATAREAAAEASAEGIDITFAPMLDIARDPRWGRIAEGPGEDPLVAASLARAKIRGYQNGGPEAIAATAKHFVGYGACTAGRDYAPVDLSQRTLSEVYLPPFRASVDEGVAAVMVAFTDVAGEPMTAHRRLLKDTLRDRWGFRGVILSDYGAIGELMRHGVAADLAEAAALALDAGVDIDMMGFAYARGLPEALARGLVTEEALDAAVARVLALKNRLGLFDDPFRRTVGENGATESAIVRRRALARAAAGRSLVLLQNRSGSLPFSKPPRRLALLGPLADAPAEMLGPWAGAGRAGEAVGVLGGLRNVWPETVLETIAGVPIDGGDDMGIAAAVAAAERADGVILCLGEAASMSGEAASRACIDLPGRQAELANAVFETGREVVVLLFSGRPIAMPDVFARAAAVVACWFPGIMAGHAVADLLTGVITPSARLAVTWPRNVGQVPIFHAARPGGRPENADDRFTSKYLDLPNSPQFAFGHGMGFGTIELGCPEVAEEDDGIRVEVKMSVSGARREFATVFLFIRRPAAHIAPPALELRAFQRVAVDPGARRCVRFQLARAALASLDAELEPAFSPGEFLVSVGLSADPAALRTARIRLG
jgi:beta-glucosidase